MNLNPWTIMGFGPGLRASVAAGVTALGIGACVSSSVPPPARTSPLSPAAEEAPVAPVATSLTSDPLADEAAPPAPASPPNHTGHHGHPGHSAAVSGAAPASVQAAADVYVCPMHPDVRQATPGTCPRCGMKLVIAPKPAPRPSPSEALPPHAHEHHAD